MLCLGTHILRCPCRRYSQATDATGGLIISFTLHNQNQFQAVEVGGMELPLAFQACTLLPAAVPYADLP